MTSALWVPALKHRASLSPFCQNTFELKQTRVYEGIFAKDTTVIFGGENRKYIAL